MKPRHDPAIVQPVTSLEKRPVHPPNTAAASAALDAFFTTGTPRALTPHGEGLINSSWRVDCDDRSYLLQALNPRVFGDPLAVMTNIRRVTTHVRGKGRLCLELLPGHDGCDYQRDQEGVYWRLYPFIDGISRQPADLDDTQLQAAARLFGRLIADLADLPGPPLETTIAGFHDTPARLAALEAAALADAVGRLADCRGELEAVRQRAALAHALTDCNLPVRAVHNDTKLDNVLFDAVSGAALCVVDLDTLMPGLPAQDFGDLVRSSFEVDFDAARYQALYRGFVDGAGRLLSDAERISLPLGPGVITFELATRFLTDHLEGDRYFRLDRPGQNLERCRSQLRLLSSMADFFGDLWP